MHRLSPLIVVALIAMGACTDRPRSPLVQAAIDNDVAAVRRLLTDGQRVDGSGESWSPLIWAARSGSVEAARVLLDSGADINRPGPTGDDWDATPLQHAILQRHPAVVRMLLERGADPERHGGPASPAPLLLAAGDVDPTYVQLLLAHGADATVEDDEGMTPLIRAVSAGTIKGPDRPMFGGCRVETVRALVAHDEALRSKHGTAWDDAVWWARVQRCGDVLRLIGE